MHHFLIFRYTEKEAEKWIKDLEKKNGQVLASTSSLISKKSHVTSLLKSVTSKCGTFFVNKTEKSFSNLAASQFCYFRSNKSTTTLQFLQGCVAWLRDCCVAKLRDCCVARLHDCCVAWLRDFCVARLRDCCVQGCVIVALQGCEIVVL
jgi:hypothetical protein